jgi:hypothetical protein
VRVELAAITRRRADQVSEFRTPIAVSATVLDSGDFTLRAGSCSTFGDPSLLVECSFGASRKTGSTGFDGGHDFIVCNDGRIVAATPGLTADSCK